MSYRSFTTQLQHAAHFSKVLGKYTIVEVLPALAIVMNDPAIEHLGTPGRIQFRDILEEQVVSDGPDDPIRMRRTPRHVDDGFAFDYVSH